MSTVPYNIGAPNTGGAVDHYALNVTVDGTTTTIEPATLSGTFTLAAGKTASVVAIAVNSAGRTAGTPQTVTAPAAVAVGPNDLTTSSDANYAAVKYNKGLSAGKATGSVVIGSAYRIGFWFLAGSPPTGVEFSHLLSLNDGSDSSVHNPMFAVSSNGNLKCVYGGTSDSGVNVCEGTPHYLLMQVDGGSQSSFQAWVDGKRFAFGSSTHAPVNGAVPLLITAAGATASSVFYGDRPGWGAISDVAIYNTATLANFQDNLGVPSQATQPNAPGLLRSWLLDGNGAAAV